MRTSLLALLALVGCAATAPLTAVSAKASVHHKVAHARTTSPSKCGWGQYDFSSLASSDLVGSDGITVDSYYLHLCGRLTSLQGAACTKTSGAASACQVQPVAGASAGLTLGQWPQSNNPNWNFIDPSNPGLGVTYSMQGPMGDNLECWSADGPHPYQTNVFFECAETQGPMTVSTVWGSCSATNYTIPTPLACPPKIKEVAAPVCGFMDYDFSSLTKSDFTGTDGITVDSYYLHLCGRLTSLQGAACTKTTTAASACQVQPVAGTSAGLTLGQWPQSNNPNWNFIDPSNPGLGVMYSLQGPTDETLECVSADGLHPYQANVILECAPTQGPMTVDTVWGSCSATNYTIPTPLACSKMFPKGSIAELI